MRRDPQLARILLMVEGIARMPEPGRRHGTTPGLAHSATIGIP